jgi:Carboxypeptidase regulatory-like domain
VECARIVGPALLLLVALRSSAAQSLLGVVRDSASRQPVPGAVVSLLDSARAPIARELTNENGEYRLRLVRPAQSVRVVRIGFSPSEAAIQRPVAGDLRLDIALVSLPSMLRAVRVLANSHCPARADRGTAMGLWEQARTGLLGAVVAREQHPASMLRLLFHRVMDGNSDRVSAMRVSADSSVDTSSFAAARTASDFVRSGFSMDAAKQALYFGPDADILMSDEFATAYCFEIARANKARPHQVGIHFLPADQRGGRIDIDGTLWIDTVARQLRDVQFAYLGGSRAAEPFHPGGSVSFQTMENGVEVIDRWSIRVVDEAVDTVASGPGVPSDIGQRSNPLALRTWLYAEEEGGELARARWPNGLEWTAALGTLRLRAVTADGRPATGSVIALVASQYFAVVDSTGVATIDELIPGPYAVRIVDPRIAELGIGLPTPLKFEAFRDSTVRATLTVPTTESFIADRCLAAHRWSVGDSVFILGRVTTPAGKPVAGVLVTVEPKVVVSQPLLHAQNPVQNFVTGPDGLFQSCVGWNIGDDVLVRVRRRGWPDVEVVRRLESRVTAVRVFAQSVP